MSYTLQTVLFSLFIVMQGSNFVDTAEEAFTNSHDSRMHQRLTTLYNFTLTYIHD
jgi:hypothetical protein